MRKTEEDKIQKVDASKMKLNPFKSSIKTTDTLKFSNTKNSLKSSNTKDSLKSSNTKDNLKSSNTKDNLKSSNTSNVIKGKAFEDRAVDFLEEKGYTILDRNSHFHHLEMDVVARDGDTLCFIEVKGRKEHSLVSGLYAVDRAKQKRLRNWATAYLCKQGYSLTNTACRFDVISIEGEKIQLIQNAF